MDIQDRSLSTGRWPFAMRSAAFLRRIAPALGVYFMAPLTAEYLLGYDTSTGDPGALLFGLVFFAPLYGSPALIIREVSRRAGRGWPTMFLLAVAFGVIQAGLVDHSLFNMSYRDIDYWQGERAPTYIPALGIVAGSTLEFISGHAIWSFCVPIAIVETLVPARRTSPWLGKPGLAIVVVLYLLVSALIFVDHVGTEQFLPSASQLLGAGMVVVALIGSAFAIGRRPRPSADVPAPHAWLVAAVALALLSLPSALDVVLAVLEVNPSFSSGWWGLGLSSMLLAMLLFLVARWSRREGWGDSHRLALAGGALLAHVWLAFLVEPLGDVSVAAKLAHNLAFAVGVAGVLAMGARRIAGSRTGSLTRH